MEDSLKVIKTVNSLVTEGGGESLDVWAILAGNSLPRASVVLDEFRRDLEAESDLTDLHVDMILRHVSSCEFGRDADQTLPTVRRFLRSVRPWCLHWHTFIQFVLRWCESHGFETIVFLGRDALPFYYLARGIAASRPTAHLVQLYVSRSEEPTVEPLVLGIDPPSLFRQRVAYVDSGCYGTLVHQLATTGHRKHGGPLPAVFFFYSRNPHIFGYMNYLTFTHFNVYSNGLSQNFPSTSRKPVSPMDIAVMALDTLEATPKPFVIKNGERLEIRVTSFLSFALAVHLYADLYLLGQRGPRESGSPSVQRTAFSALEQLWEIYRQSYPWKRHNDGMFWIPPTPKWVKGESWLGNWDLGTMSPQTEVFGMHAG